MAQGRNRGQRQYLVVGFPESRSGPNPRSRDLPSKPTAFIAPSTELGTYSRLGLSPKSHVILSVDVGRMIAPDGSVQAIPDPHGMSGSPLFLLYGDVGANDLQVTPVMELSSNIIKRRRQSSLRT